MRVAFTVTGEMVEINVRDGRYSDEPASYRVAVADVRKSCWYRTPIGGPRRNGHSLPSSTTTIS
jgi:hypothetical protein